MANMDNPHFVFDDAVIDLVGSAWHDQFADIVCVGRRSGIRKVFEPLYRIFYRLFDRQGALWIFALRYSRKSLRGPRKLAAYERVSIDRGACWLSLRPHRAQTHRAQLARRLRGPPRASHHRDARAAHRRQPFAASPRLRSFLLVILGKLANLVDRLFQQLCLHGLMITNGDRTVKPSRTPASPDADPSRPWRGVSCPRCGARARRGSVWSAGAAPAAWRRGGRDRSAGRARPAGCAAACGDVAR